MKIGFRKPSIITHMAATFLAVFHKKVYNWNMNSVKLISC